MKAPKHSKRETATPQKNCLAFDVKTQESDYKEYARHYFVRPAETYLIFLSLLLLLWIYFNARAGHAYGKQVWFLLCFLFLMLMVAKNGAKIAYRVSQMQLISIHYRFDDTQFSAKAGKDIETHEYSDIHRVIVMQDVLILKMRPGAFILPYRTLPDKEMLFTHLKARVDEKKWRHFERRPKRGSNTQG